MFSRMTPTQDRRSSRDSTIRNRSRPRTSWEVNHLTMVGMLMAKVVCSSQEEEAVASSLAAGENYLMTRARCKEWVARILDLARHLRTWMDFWVRTTILRVRDLWVHSPRFIKIKMASKSSELVAAKRIDKARSELVHLSIVSRARRDRWEAVKLQSRQVISRVIPGRIACSLKCSRRIESQWDRTLQVRTTSHLHTIRRLSNFKRPKWWHKVTPYLARTIWSLASLLNSLSRTSRSRSQPMLHNSTPSLWEVTHLMIA